MYIIVLKLNSTFGTIGNAMAYKMTSKKVGGETQSFCFCVKN